MKSTEMEMRNGEPVRGRKEKEQKRIVRGELELARKSTGSKMLG